MRPSVSALLTLLLRNPQELAKFFWGYAIIVGALILVWLAKEAIDFIRVKADNKRVDRAGFEVCFPEFHAPQTQLIQGDCSCPVRTA
jgi:hypothetical protein